VSAIKISEREKQCLQVLADAVVYPEQAVLFYSHIIYETGLELPQARRAVRALARKGLAERSACFDDDGMIQGSGYSCTDAGAALIAGASEVIATEGQGNG
jgi:predicted transcriptional regulator